MINTFNGTPFTGYVSLTNAAPGPTAFTLFQQMGQPAYTLGALERLYITNVTISSSDTAQQLVTVDTGGTTPTKITRAYDTGSTFPPISESMPAGTCRCIHGVVPRASAGAVTAGKSIECIIKGFISRT